MDKKAHCLLFSAVISSVKSFNVERHYKIDAAQYDFKRRSDTKENQEKES